MRHAVPLAALVLLAAACTAAEAPAQEPEPSPVPPPLEVAAWVNSQPLALADLKGQVVLLDFWSTVHGHCRKQMPRLQALAEKHKARGLVVLGVAEEEKADIERFAKDHRIAYPLAADTLADGHGKTFDACRIVDVPTTWLIARDGTVAWRGRGEELTEAMVLAELAKKPPPEAPKPAEDKPQ